MKNDKKWKSIFASIEESKPMKTLASLLEGTTKMTVGQCTGSLPTFVSLLLYRRYRATQILVYPDYQTAVQHAEDIRSIAPDLPVVQYVSTEERLVSQTEELDTDIIYLTSALSEITKHSTAIVITTPAALLTHVPPPHSIEEHYFCIEKGDAIPYQSFLDIFFSNGYSRKEYVEIVGDIAVRGGIVDVFPPNLDAPIRLEFFGNEIDRIREFDPLSQRSIREVASVDIMTHLFHNDDAELSTTLFDHVPSNSTLFLMRAEEVEVAIEEQGIQEIHEKFAEYRQVRFSLLSKGDLSFEAKVQPPANNSIKEFIKIAKPLAARNTTPYFCSDGDKAIDRFRELLDNCLDDLTSAEEFDESIGNEEFRKKLRSLSYSPVEGFIFPAGKIALFTEHQIFARQRAVVRRRKTARSTGLRDLSQLKHGDYVVHVDKGIAQYQGMETITIRGTEQECIRLLFADDAKVFLNVNYINKLQKYSAQDGTPKLSKLNTREWERKKERTKKKLKDIARDLIRLYAERSMKPGYAFPEDTLWQKELEASFMYEDTPDQATATAEVKEDMMAPHPMDRLVCGDVGFGKTEVAIRAAFKAVQAGKQVAVLVPTTILAQQHFNSFKDRLERYAVRVDVLSRFRTAADQKDILSLTKKGTIDVLIGTHRILSKDLHFKDLGLLIIDEEHRFGVGAKEKLRQLRADVDTLTLTATPIPRTLNFSLMGARSMSMIKTPPRNRLPIHTEILMWEVDIIAKAIKKELSRGGQVFIVSDRISVLPDLQDKLLDMIPTIRTGIAHGGMEAREIEKVMEKFLERKLDVLISTKLIESGIDIPNANTMIIHNSHNFGLAELYQLRGRVGRSNTQAFCYLVVPTIKALSRTALRRLQAIEEFTDLGSGLHLAMRDMEIRGAGNLLGAEQSGFITDIGFELFQRILDDAVSELKEEEFAELFANKQHNDGRTLMPNYDMTVETDTNSALIPATYITSDIERFDFYKKLYRAENEQDITAIVDEMKDRFGLLPPEVMTLLDIVKVRAVAMQLGFSSLTLKNKKGLAEFPPATKKEFYGRIFPSLLQAVSHINEAKILQKDDKVYLSFPAHNADYSTALLCSIRDNLLNILNGRSVA